MSLSSNGRTAARFTPLEVCQAGAPPLIGLQALCVPALAVVDDFDVGDLRAFGTRTPMAFASDAWQDRGPAKHMARSWSFQERAQDPIHAVDCDTCSCLHRTILRRAPLCDCV